MKTKGHEHSRETWIAYAASLQNRAREGEFSDAVAEQIFENEWREAYPEGSNAEGEMVATTKKANKKESAGLEEALEELGKYIESLTGKNPRKLKTIQEVQDLNDKLKEKTEQAAVSEGAVRSKAQILHGITVANSFDRIVEVLCDIRDSLRDEGPSPVPTTPVVKGSPRRRGKISSEDLKQRNAKHLKEAGSIIKELNMLTGKRFRCVESNVAMVKQRLTEAEREGYENPVRLCSLIMRMKVQESRRGDFNPTYLRPATLFNKTKFWQYAGEIPIETKEDKQ